MNIRSVSHVVAILLMVVAVSLALCWGISILMDDAPAVRAGIGHAALAALAAGSLLWVTTLGRSIDLSRRDGFGIVTFGWLAVSLFGAVPYWLSGVVDDLAGGTAGRMVAAVFETMSGFTTTGASVFTDIDALPFGILFWRSLTQWFGGMGVLVLCVAILPYLGVGGMQIYRAEMPGPSKDRLTPRITSTAKLLWAVYVLLTALETVLLRFGGLGWFDATCHAFTTMSTGGFSTRAASVAAFDSVYVESVIVVFMFIAGINFVLHYRALTGRVGVYFTNPECLFYGGVVLVVSLFIAVNIWFSATYLTFVDALRDAVFQVVSMATTTGYCTANFDQWPLPSKLLLFTLMFFGGCAGSTAGGIKLVRVFIVIKKVVRDLRRFMHPQAIIQVKLGPTAIEPDVIAHITGFVLMFVLIFATGTLAMSFCTEDLWTAASSIAATLGNIGPGFGAVGAAENYAAIATPGKMVLIVAMLLGRLELYTVLVLLLPSFWKK